MKDAKRRLQRLTVVFRIMRQLTVPLDPVDITAVSRPHVQPYAAVQTHHFRSSG